MKFMQFFFLVSVVSIICFMFAEDQITTSDFYQNYLHNDSEVVEKDAELKPINASELPSVVMESFTNSPFGKHTISQVYLIPAKEASDLISQIVSYSFQDTSEETYLLSLKGKKVETQLRFSKSGKLIKVISA